MAKKKIVVKKTAAKKAAAKKPVAKKVAVRKVAVKKAVAKKAATKKVAAKKKAPPRAGTAKSTQPLVKGLLIKRKLRVHAIPLSDTDGKRAPTFSADNLAKGIARANQALSNAAIELVFDPAKDWHPRKDTALNNLKNGGSNWWVKGNEVAARIPGKIVIFFRHGEGADPVGWGHAYPPNTGQAVPSSVTLPTDNVNYVAMPHVNSWDIADRGNFLAHEVGHYLGLFHTHPGWGTGEIYGDADTQSEAEQRLLDFAAANGGTLSAFNGDLVADTSPDCCRNLYSERGLSHTSSGPASVTVSGKSGGKNLSLTFTPPRDNVMSYFFWGAPQRITNDQATIIHQTLQHPHRRILIEPPCNPDFHNLDSGKFQLCFDYWRLRGLEPQTLSANRVGTKTLMSGSFKAGSSDPVWILMTSDEYQQRFNAYAKDGMRPDRVVVTDTPAGPRYSAIWRKAEGPFEASHGMTVPQFEKRWKELHEAGWLHADMFVYPFGSTHRVSSVWVKTATTGYATYLNMTAAGYQQKFDDYWAKGLRVTTFCAYRHGTGYRYAAIWERKPGRWGHWFGMSAAGYQAKYDELAKTGHRLHQIQGYGNYFSAIWTG